MPKFVGGSEAMHQFIAENLKFPPECSEMGIQGRVFVRLTITKHGIIENTNVIRGIEANCDKEALRVVIIMPNWIPAKHNGEYVDAYFTLPVVFRLRH